MIPFADTSGVIVRHGSHGCHMWATEYLEYYLMPVSVAPAIVSTITGTVGHVLPMMDRYRQVERTGSAQNVCANVKIMTCIFQFCSINI